MEMMPIYFPVLEVNGKQTPVRYGGSLNWVIDPYEVDETARDIFRDFFLRGLEFNPDYVLPVPVARCEVLFYEAYVSEETDLEELTPAELERLFATAELVRSVIPDPFVLSAQPEWSERDLESVFQERLERVSNVPVARCEVFFEREYRDMEIEIDYADGARVYYAWDLEDFFEENAFNEWEQIPIDCLVAMLNDIGNERRAGTVAKAS